MRKFILLYLGSTILTSLYLQAIVNARTPSLFKQRATEADVIMIGSGQRESTDGALIKLSPLRILKGPSSLKDGGPVTAVWKPEFKGNSVPVNSKTGTGLWFLKGSENSGFTILPAVRENEWYFPFFGNKSPEDVGLAYGEADSYEKKLVSMIGAELEGSWGVGGNNRVGRIVSAVIGLSVDELDGLSDLAARFSKSESARLRAISINWRIHGGDGAALSELALDKDVLELYSKPNLPINGIGYFRSEDPRDIETLAKLTDAQYPTSLREEAAYVLRAVHNKAAVPHLAKLLDSDLKNTRYNAVAGLAAFAQGLPIATPENIASGGWLAPKSKSVFATEEVRDKFPATDIFDQNEGYYIGFWQGWWAANQAKIAQ